MEASVGSSYVEPSVYRRRKLSQFVGKCRKSGVDYYKPGLAAAVAFAAVEMAAVEMAAVAFAAVAFAAVLPTLVELEILAAEMVAQYH